MPSLNFNGRSLADGALPRHRSPAASRVHERSCIQAGTLAVPRGGGGSGALRSAPPASRGLRSCWIPAGTPGLGGNKEIRGASGGARRDGVVPEEMIPLGMGSLQWVMFSAHTPLLFVP